MVPGRRDMNRPTTQGLWVFGSGLEKQLHFHFPWSRVCQRALVDPDEMLDVGISDRRSSGL